MIDGQVVGVPYDFAAIAIAGGQNPQPSIWLKTTFGVDIDFEVDDALAKLERLGLLKRDGQKLSVLPLDEALILLDRRWDNFFLFANRADALPVERFAAK